MISSTVLQFYNWERKILWLSLCVTGTYCTSSTSVRTGSIVVSTNCRVLYLYIVCIQRYRVKNHGLHIHGFEMVSRAGRAFQATGETLHIEKDFLHKIAGRHTYTGTAPGILCDFLPAEYSEYEYS